MKKLLILFLAASSFSGMNAQLFTAGTNFADYHDIGPDTLVYYVYNPSTIGLYQANVFDSLVVDIGSHGSSSPGGSIAFIDVTPLDPDLYIGFGRLDSVFDSTTSTWLVTKVAKPLQQGDTIDTNEMIWDNSRLYITNHSASFGWKKEINDWIGGDKFLALKHVSLAGVNYGWIRLNCVDQDSCYVKDLSYSASVPAGIREGRDRSGISVYPNPFLHILTVRVQEGSCIESLCLYNGSGKQVLRKNSRSNHEEIDLERLPAGIYLLRLRSGDDILTRKVIKK